MPRDRILYRETYTRGTSISDACLPVIRHFSNSGTKVPHTVVRTDLLAAGTIEVNGERLEFQDLRIYVRFP